MKLTKLSAAPERQDKVPPCAPADKLGGGTASQLIRGVRQTRGRVTRAGARMGNLGRIVASLVAGLAFVGAMSSGTVQIYADGKLRGAFEPRGEPYATD